MTGNQTEHYRSACDAATSWIAHLRSDAATVQDQWQFSLWLAEDPSHQRAIDHMLELWDDLGAVAHLPGLDIDDAQEHDEQRSAASNSRWFRPSLALAASVLAAALFLPTLWQGQADQNTYATAMGEQREVELADQTVIKLNTDTRLTVTFDDDARHIELQRGEAHFTVAPDAQRPFHVDTGSARITAIGTAFNIYRSGTSTDITVTEGVVRVTEQGETGSRPPAVEILHANQSVNAKPGGLSAAATADVDKNLAWQRGELIAENMRLPELITELERYHPTRILITDPEVASLTVSGVFQLQQPESILNALEVSLELQVERLDANTVSLLRANR